MKALTPIVILMGLLSSLALPAASQCPKAISYEEARKDKRTCSEVCCGKHDKPAPCNCGLLNQNAISLPAPVFPKKYDARNTSAIMVHVYIDEAGKVFFARACSNTYPKLSRAAVKAAYKAQFHVNTCSGRPIRIDGLVTYKLPN
jgi:hypothetical protein